jgi:nucleotide-binding universal stress UspA family protein
MSEITVPRRILVPTDFSEFASAAVVVGAALATRFDARLTLMFADEFVPPVDFIEAPASFYADTLPQSREAIEKRLARELETLPPEVHADSTVVTGAPAAAIASAADSKDYDLIVMGTHGRSGWRRLLLGSVTENVLRRTSRPILTIRPLSDPPRQAPWQVGRILCPVNRTAVARQALGHAVAWAAAFDAELIFVQVVEGKGDRYLDREELRDWLPARYRDRHTYLAIEKSAYTSEQIINLGREANADMIVIGAQQKRFLDTTVIGTTSERVTRFALQPVLTVIAKVDEELPSERDEATRHSSFPPVLTG